MKLKHSALATLLLAGALSSPAVQATTAFEDEAFGSGAANDTIATAQDLGSLGASSFVDVFGSRLSALPGSNSIDFYKIALSLDGLLTLVVNTPGGPTLANDPMVGLFNSAGSLLAYDDDGLVGWDSKLTWAATAGTYYVAVTGFDDYTFVGDGNSYTSEGAQFTYSLEASTAPVPEPETYALMLAGLGVLGAIGRRRNSR